MGRFKEGLHKAVETAKYAGSQTKTAYKGSKELSRDVKDKMKSYTVDLSEAAKDKNFDKFLKETGKEIDWNEKKGEVKEAYIEFKRFEKVSKNYESLFEGKLNKLVGDKTEMKKSLEKHLKKLAKENPAELRHLEKNIDRVLKSEEDISKLQKGIDSYDIKGGKDGLEDKIKTLKEAKSFSRIFLQYSGLSKIGFGEKKKLAYEKAKKDYGFDDRKSMKEAIALAKKDIKAISKLEDAKVNVKTKFRKARSEVFLDNDAAKSVHEVIKDKIIQQFIDANENSYEDMTKLRDTQKELRNQFSKEGTKQYTGKKKLILKNESDRDLDFLNTSGEEMMELDKEINKKIEELLKAQFEKIAQSAPIGEMEKRINKYFQRSEFAGMTRVESANKLYNMLKIVKGKLRGANDRVSQLSAIMTRLRPLTV